MPDTTTTTTPVTAAIPPLQARRRIPARACRFRTCTTTAAGFAGCAPVVEEDEAVLAIPAAAGVFDDVRLEVDWDLGSIDPEFVHDEAGWSLQLPRPPVWRMEYQLSIRAGDRISDVLDPGNPRQVANPFGAKSEIRFPDYVEPAWLHTVVTGTPRSVAVEAGKLGIPVPVTLWSPAGLADTTPAPLLLVNDGSDTATRGSLLAWASAAQRSGPLRLALLDPAPGHRDEWYAANPDYADDLAQVVIPALTGAVVTSAVVGLGASLGALAMLALHRRYPGALAAAALQSGSYFVSSSDAKDGDDQDSQDRDSQDRDSQDRDSDDQESGRPLFKHVCAAVVEISENTDRTADGTPGHPIPLFLTVGAVEENRANNEKMAAALSGQGYRVRFDVVPDAHTMIGWRDAWSPGLDNLLEQVR